MTGGLPKSLRVVREGGLLFFRNHGTVYSAAVAFNILLSAIPILFLTFAGTSLFIGSYELPFSQLSEFLHDAFPYGAQVLVPNLKRLFEARGAFGVAGSVLLLFASFSTTEAIHTSLSVMLMRKRQKRITRSLGFHVVFMLVLILLTASAIVIPPLWEGLSYVTEGLSARFDVAFHALLHLVGSLAVVGMLFVGGALSYRFLVPGKIRLRNALAGTAVFVVLEQAVKFGFTFYVRKFSRLNLLYGSLFSLICFIIVAYLFAAAYLYGASVIGVLERLEGETPIPQKGNGTADDTTGGD
jgi:YihY family inner membrane protein